MSNNTAEMTPLQAADAAQVAYIKADKAEAAAKAAKAVKETAWDAACAAEVAAEDAAEAADAAYVAFLKVEGCGVCGKEPHCLTASHTQGKAMNEIDLLEAIQDILSGNEWGADTPAEIAELMNDNGYTIEDENCCYA